jgi:hypothetical protein
MISLKGNLNKLSSTPLEFFWVLINFFFEALNLKRQQKVIFRYLTQQLELEKDQITSLNARPLK